MTPSHMHRRSFIRQTALGGAAAVTALSASRVYGANNKVRLGFIGCGGRGRQSIAWFSKLADVEIAALCDVDSNTLTNAVNKVKEETNPSVVGHTDQRKILDDPSIDAVVISNTNHWHALSAIWACQAGKDVYVEKPVSWSVAEGRLIVDAARKYNRIVQGGTQQRSDPFQAQLKKFLHEDKTLGKIKWVRLNRYGMRSSIGKRTTPLEIPETVDYNLWLGPAADQPIMRNRLHYDWHWDFNTGNGELGNWGPHITDDLRNVVFQDKVTHPKRILSGGGRLGWNDAGDTPNTHFTYFDTGDIPVIMDVHNLPRGKEVKANDVWMARRTGAFLVIECEGGYYAGGRGGGSAYDNDRQKIAQFKGNAGGGHARNFIDAIKSRKRDDLNAEIEETHYSSAWCHLGNNSYQLGGEYDREEATAQLDLPQWKQVIDEFHTHLDANGIDPAKEDIRLGAPLEFDAKKEVFTGSTAKKANKMLLRETYRKGFELKV